MLLVQLPLTGMCFVMHLSVYADRCTILTPSMLIFALIYWAMTLLQTGDKPYLCEVCWASFQRSDALRHHWRSERSCGLKIAEMAQAGTLGQHATELLTADQRAGHKFLGLDDDHDTAASASRNTNRRSPDALGAALSQPPQSASSLPPGPAPAAATAYGSPFPYLGFPGAPGQPIKRKRGRPRKNPLPGSIGGTLTNLGAGAQWGGAAGANPWAAAAATAGAVGPHTSSLFPFSQPSGAMGLNPNASPAAAMAAAAASVSPMFPFSAYGMQFNPFVPPFFPSYGYGMVPPPPFPPQGLTATGGSGFSGARGNASSTHRAKRASRHSRADSSDSDAASGSDSSSRSRSGSLASNGSARAPQQNIQTTSQADTSAQAQDQPQSNPPQSHLHWGGEDPESEAGLGDALFQLQRLQEQLDREEAAQEMSRDETRQHDVNSLEGQDGTASRAEIPSHQASAVTGTQDEAAEFPPDTELEQEPHPHPHPQPPPQPAPQTQSSSLTQQRSPPHHGVQPPPHPHPQPQPQSPTPATNQVNPVSLEDQQLQGSSSPGRSESRTDTEQRNESPRHFSQQSHERRDLSSETQLRHTPQDALLEGDAAPKPASETEAAASNTDLESNLADHPSGGPATVSTSTFNIPRDTSMAPATPQPMPHHTRATGEAAADRPAALETHSDGPPADSSVSGEPVADAAHTHAVISPPFGPQHNPEGLSAAAQMLSAAWAKYERQSGPESESASSRTRKSASTTVDVTVPATISNSAGEASISGPNTALSTTDTVPSGPDPSNAQADGPQYQPQAPEQRADGPKNGDPDKGERQELVQQQAHSHQHGVAGEERVEAEETDILDLDLDEEQLALLYAAAREVAEEDGDGDGDGDDDNDHNHNHNHDEGDDGDARGTTAAVPASALEAGTSGAGGSKRSPAELDRLPDPMAVKRLRVG